MLTVHSIRVNLYLYNYKFTISIYIRLFKGEKTNQPKKIQRVKFLEKKGEKNMRNNELFKRIGFNVFLRGKDKNFSTFYLYDKEDSLEEKGSMICVASELEVYDMGDENNDSKLLSWKELKNTDGLFEEVSSYLKIWLNGNVYPESDAGRKRKEFQSLVQPPLDYLERYNLFGPTGKSPYSYINIKELMKSPNFNEKLLDDISIEGFNFKCYKNNNVYYCKCVNVEVGRSGNGERSLRVKSSFRIYNLFSKREIDRAELKEIGISGWFVRTIGMWINGKANPCVKNKDVINWHGAIVDNTFAIKKKKSLIDEGVKALSAEMYEQDLFTKQFREGSGKTKGNPAPVKEDDGCVNENKPGEISDPIDEQKIDELARLIQIGNKLCDFFRIGVCDSDCAFVKDCEDIEVCQSKLTAKFLFSNGLTFKEGYKNEK